MELGKLRSAGEVLEKGASVSLRQGPHPCAQGCRPEGVCSQPRKEGQHQHLPLVAADFIV